MTAVACLRQRYPMWVKGCALVPLWGRRSAPPAGGALLTHSCRLGLRRYVILRLGDGSLRAHGQPLIRQVLDMTTLDALVEGPIQVLGGLQVTTTTRASSQQHPHLAPHYTFTNFRTLKPDLSRNYVPGPHPALLTRPIR